MISKVLIVEDDPFTRDFLSELLGARGYEVEAAENGALALEAFFPQTDIELIITDIMMPEMTGLELTRKLRSEGHEVPIIILFGNNEISIAIDAINSGADDYVMKIEDIQDVITIAITRVLEKRMLKEQNKKLIETLIEKNSQLEEANMKLMDLASNDSLTGLRNRRVFFEEFEKHLNLFKRYGSSLSVVLIDIDDFKSFNDGFGHIAGDNALKQTVGIIENIA
jgi:two-component system chemotaxis family response regulator WspR